METKPGPQTFRGRERSKKGYAVYVLKRTYGYGHRKAKATANRQHCDRIFD